MITHAIICGAQIWHQRVIETCRNITTILIIMAMFLQIMLSIIAIQFLNYNEQFKTDTNKFTSEFKVFN
jgi:hypothetical protein